MEQLALAPTVAAVGWPSSCPTAWCNIRNSFDVLGFGYIFRAMVGGGLVDIGGGDGFVSFGGRRRKALDDIVARASSGDSSKKFATEENLSLIQKQLYSLAQCTPDLSASNCSDCLTQCTDNLFSKYGGYSYAMYRFPSCNAGFATYPFYSTFTASPHSPPPVLPPRLLSPPPVLPPHSPPPVFPLPHPPTSNPGTKGISFKVLNLIAIVVPIGVSIIVLAVACFCFISRRAKKKVKNIREDSVWTEITSVKSLQYDLGVIEAATNNFSDENKIGGDGFGPLYKGLLADGQTTITVKKLSRTSGQGIEEFKNEVVSVATLQHRNLVKLLGFCLEGEEKILIYELAPNKSLDCVLFDPQQQPLDWSRRYKIIRDIAGGMLYLHEDSQLRIIHGDLKASNILLDGDMNVCISDFGIARILGVDKNQGNASEIDGTLDHMSSEYAMHGQWSVKSDVFSFGILVLEIITRRKNNVLYQSDTPMDLLSYARKLWSDEAPLDLMDATEIGPYSKNEVTRCIHVALLCVQDDPDARPSMAIVVPMLDGYSTTLSIPQPPAFLAQSRTEIALNRSRSKSIVWSVNEASISELEPR